MKKIRCGQLALLSFLSLTLSLTACGQAENETLTALGSETETLINSGAETEMLTDSETETERQTQIPESLPGGNEETADSQQALLPSESEPSADGILVVLADQSVYMSLVLPSGWEYSVTPHTDLYVGCGIGFWPEDVEEGQITLSYYEGFGVCGTGLISETITFSDGLTAEKGTYDGHDWWDFIHFQTEGEGSYVAMTVNVESWWTEYEAEVMRILDSVRFSPDADRSFVPETAEATIID